MTSQSTAPYRLPQGERHKAVHPFVGKVCKVTYRTASGKHETEGNIVGASYHRTNGNSTGDLIIEHSDPTMLFGFGGGRYECQSIALAHVMDIVEVT